MVIDPLGQGGKQGGLSVVAASHDEGHPLGDPHPPDGPGIGPLQGHRQRLRGGEGDSSPPQGTIRDAGGAGEDRPLGDERHQPPFGELASQGLGILAALHVPPYRLGIEAPIEESSAYQLRELGEEHRLRLPPQHPPPRRREARREDGLHPCLGDAQCGPGEDALTEIHGGKLPRAARTPLSLGHPGDLPGQGPDQKILQSHSPGPGPEEVAGKAGHLPGHLYPEPAGGGERIPLYVLHVEGEAREPPGPPEALVGPVARPVNSPEEAD